MYIHIYIYVCIPHDRSWITLLLVFLLLLCFSFDISEVICCDHLDYLEGFGHPIPISGSAFFIPSWVLRIWSFRGGGDVWDWWWWCRERKKVCGLLPQRSHFSLRGRRVGNGSSCNGVSLSLVSTLLDCRAVSSCGLPPCPCDDVKPSRFFSTCEHPREKRYLWFLFIRCLRFWSGSAQVGFLIGWFVSMMPEMAAGGAVCGGLESWFQKLIVDGDERTTGMKGWKDLPMELLMRIMACLDDRMVIVAAGVCTGWRDAICLGLTRFSLSWCHSNMDNLLLSLSPKFTKVQVLCLRQTRPELHDNAIEALSSYCHDLRDLDLSKSLLLTDRSLVSLAHGCPHLTQINISGCASFSDSSLAYLTTYCRSLKKINLCGCVNAATDRALQAIASNCPQLQALNLGWCEKVSDKGVTSLAYGCPDLRALDLCGCILITDESVVALATRCIHLGSLGLYYCQNITDKAMYSLANSRPHSLRGSTPSSLEDGLTNLNISQCTALTATAVQAVCNSFPSLHTCPVKHSLIISGCLGLTSVRCACAVQARHADVSHLTHQFY